MPLKTFLLSFFFFLFAEPLVYSQYSSDEKLLYTRILNITSDSLKYKKLIQAADSLFENNSHPDFTLFLLKMAFNTAKANAYCIKEVEALNKMAVVYRYEGELNKANDMYQHALKHSCLLDTMRLKADIYYNLGLNKGRALLFKEALASHNKALNIYLSIRYNAGIGRVYRALSILSAYSNDVDREKIYFDKAEKIFLENHLTEDKASLLFNKVRHYYALNDFELAKYYTYATIAAHTKIRTKESYNRIASTYMSLALFYIHNKKADSALYYLNRGKQIADSLNSFGFHFKFYYDLLGRCYNESAKYGKAIAAYKEAIVAFKGEKNGYSKDLRSLLAETYSKIKQYDSAYFYKTESMNIQDSIHDKELKQNFIESEELIDLMQEDYANKKKILEAQSEKEKLNTTKIILLFIIGVLTLIAFLVFLFYRNYNLKIKKENLISQVDFLKAQLNPHFLFNSINNIYVLIDVNPKKASSVLLKFSELLRYQLYDCNVTEISLTSEIRFIKNFILFEKLRYDNKIEVQLTSDDVEDNTLKIAPLILQPFIENAFKHVPKSKYQHNYINITIKAQNNKVLLFVENNYNVNETSKLPGGIGLENVKKRLNLLYKDAYEFTLNKTIDKYSMKLNLELKK